MRWFTVRSMLAVLAFVSATAVLSTHLRAEDAKPGEWKAPARAAKKKNPVASDDKSIAAGKTVYVGNCLACHGKTGKGDGPSAAGLEPHPGDLSSSKVQDQTDGELFWKVTVGRKPMPTYEKTLSEEQRWQVVNYLRTLKATDSK